LVIEYNPATYN